VTDPACFIRASTAIGHHPLVPEIALYLASEITPIWTATEAWLEQTGTSPPFWAFAWPGSQALARYVLDHPDLVAGRRVLACAPTGTRQVQGTKSALPGFCGTPEDPGPVGRLRRPDNQW